MSRLFCHNLGILFLTLAHAVCVNTLSENLQKNLAAMKKLLPSEDILSYEFETADNTACAIVYADGIVNKQLLGDLIARPLSQLALKNEGGRYENTLEMIKKSALFPELKEMKKLDDLGKEVLDGNALLLIDGLC